MDNKGFIGKSEFYYDLPERLIAQEPLARRDTSRLLVLNRQNGQIIHENFGDLHKYLNSGDCLVLNDTKVIPARLTGTKDTGAVVELLLLRRLENGLWKTLARPAKRLKAGDIVTFGDGVMKAEIVGTFDEGVRHVRLVYDGIFEEVLDSLGEMPLPPYITKKLGDKSRYQTVYAEKAGSAAAPTAGLHFTNELLCSLAEKGVKTAKITLHVGLGTFRPIKCENILDHAMHSERFFIDAENAAVINEARANGGRIVCVGTTSVRTLESIASLSSDGGKVAEVSGETDIFIYPGYKFKITDAMITNFHLPESTLMALVSAFAGTEKVLAAYGEAVLREYRFFSFGDAMLIV